MSAGRLRRPGGVVPAGALFLLLVAIVYADPLLARRNFGGRDLIKYNLPLEKNVHDAYARGRLPVWSQEISGGRPLLPNPNVGALYPVRALLALTSFPVAMRVFPILHWALAGLGMMVLLRALAASPGAAWIGAVTYVFSGVGVSALFFPHLHPGIALLPWVPWALCRPGERIAERALVLSLPLALMFLAGELFTAGIALLAGILWIAVEESGRRRTTAAAVLGLGATLAALLALPQIVATALWIPETTRAVQGIRLGEAFLLSISPARWLELLVPYPFGATWALDPTLVWAPSVFHGKSVGLFATLYAGGFALASLVLLARAPSRLRRGAGVRLAFVLLILAAAAAVLPSLLPASWSSLPSPVALRNPEKFGVAVAFALAILAGKGFDEIRQTARRPAGWMLAVGGVTAILALAALLVPAAARAIGQRGSASADAGRLAVAQLPGALAEGGLLWMATLLAVEALASGGRAATAVSLVLLTVIPIAATRPIAQTFGEEELLAPTAFARFLTRQDPAGQFRALGADLYRPDSLIAAARAGSDRGETEFARRDWVHDTPALWGRGLVFNADFDRGDLTRLESLRRFSGLLSASPASAALFGSVGLRWSVRYRDQAPLPGYRRIGGDAAQDWDELPGALPEVRLLQRWREETGPVAALDVLRRAVPDEVVIETGARREGTAPPGSIRRLETTPERLVVQVEAAAATWLFVLRGYWSHRTIRLDGAEIAQAPAQLAFSAIPIPPGRHLVEWEERVPGLRISAWGPVLFAFAAGALLLRTRMAGGQGSA